MALSDSTNTTKGVFPYEDTAIVIPNPDTPYPLTCWSIVTLQLQRSHARELVPDETPVRLLCRRMFCTQCRMIGSHIRAGFVAVRERACLSVFEGRNPGPRNASPKCFIQASGMGMASIRSGKAWSDQPRIWAVTLIHVQSQHLRTVEAARDCVCTSVLERRAAHGIT
jgi:hypothetical protein